jgi:CheY-like chemotaxis protein
MPGEERLPELHSTIQLPGKQRELLVVEDDLAAQDIWQKILGAVCPTALVRWARTEEGAEMQIRNRLKTGGGFDLVIVDIFLAGKKTGIDLWRRYGCGPTRFLFASCVSPGQFASMIDDAKGECRMPILLDKPLKLSDCVEAVRNALGSLDGLQSTGRID